MAGATDTIDSVAQFASVLLLFILVLALAYVAARLTGRLQQGRLRSGNLEVLETLQIAPGRFVQIIRIGSRYQAIAISKDRIDVLAELSGEDIKLPSENACDASSGFSDILEKAKNAIKKK